MMDGDNLGEWLRGKHMPKVREIMHPKLCSWYNGLNDQRVSPALEARRPVGPALHATISGALGRFATRIAPQIVENKLGTLIYSGGDDLLALLPAQHAVACARSLRDAYRGGDADGQPGMGERASISAGVAFVHYKEDLRLALAATRVAEKHSKQQGRDAMTLRFMRRSGEHSDALIGWENSIWFDELTRHFTNGASNRWAYRLRAELPVLMDMPNEMIVAEIRRLGNRVDSQSQGWAGNPKEDFGALVARHWERYRRDRHCRARRLGKEPTLGDWLEDFTALCQGAAFVARGRDD